MHVGMRLRTAELRLRLLMRWPQRFFFPFNLDMKKRAHCFPFIINNGITLSLCVNLLGYKYNSKIIISLMTIWILLPIFVVKYLLYLKIIIFLSSKMCNCRSSPSNTLLDQSAMTLCFIYGCHSKSLSNLFLSLCLSASLNYYQFNI